MCTGNKTQIQAVIDCSIFPPLIQLLGSAEWDIKKEAAWAISNATSGGTPEQLRYLLSQNCIPPLCELLTCADVRIIVVALEALENLLKVGQQDAAKYGQNKVATFIEDAGGLDKIEGLQSHPNHEIYEKAVKLLEIYFAASEEEQIAAIAPAQQGGAFQFGPGAGGPPAGALQPGQAPPAAGGGFNF